MDKFMQTVRSAKTMVRTDQQNTRAHTALLSFSFIDLGRGVPAGRPIVFQCVCGLIYSLFISLGSPY